MDKASQLVNLEQSENCDVKKLIRHEWDVHAEPPCKHEYMAVLDMNIIPLPDFVQFFCLQLSSFLHLFKKSFSCIKLFEYLNFSRIHMYLDSNTIFVHLPLYTTTMDFKLSNQDVTEV